MSRKRRLVVALLILAPTLGILIAAVIYLFVLANRAASRLDVVLVAELEQRLEREVRIGRVQAKPLGRFVIYDFAVADGKSFAAGTLITADRIEARYRWLDLALGRKPAIQTIETVTVTGGMIRVIRLKTGKWNVISLFRRPPGPPPPAFLGRVVVVNGRAVVKDLLGGTPERPAMGRFSGINGMVDASASGGLIAFAGSMAGDHVRRSKFTGRYSSRRGSLDLDIVASGGDAAFWGAYQSMLKPFRVLGGVIDTHLTIARTLSNGRPHWGYVGSATLEDVTASVPQLAGPIKNVSGKVEFANELVAVDLRATAARSPVLAKGTIVLKPKLMVRLSLVSPGMNYSVLSRSVRVPKTMAGAVLEGAGPARIFVVGSPGSLAIDTSARIPVVRAWGYELSDVALTGGCAGGIIKISQISGRTFGGVLSGGGFVDARTPACHIELSGEAKQISLSRIPAVKRAKLAGVGDAEFKIVGSIFNPSAHSSVKVSAGSFNMIPFSQASGDLVISQGRLLVENLTGAVAGGAVKISGTVTQTGLDMKMSAFGVDVAQALRPFGFKDIGGVAYYRGTVNGEIANPQVAGLVEVFDGRFANVSFDYARGQVVGGQKSLVLSDTMVKRYPTEVTVSGKILNVTSQRPRFDLEVDVARSSAKDVLQTFGLAVDVTGSVSGRFSIAGAVPAVRVAGGFRFGGGSVAGVPIAFATGDVVYEDGTTSVTDLIARTGGAAIAGQGAARSSGELDFQFSGAEIPASVFDGILKPYVAVGGLVDMSSGTVTGTVGSPHAAVSLSGTDFDLNGERFGKVAAEVIWDGEAVRVSDASLSSGVETYKVAGFSFEPKTGVIDLRGSVESGRIERLLSAIRNSPYMGLPEAEDIRAKIARVPQPLSGALTISNLEAGGKLGDLKGRLEASVSDLTLSGQRVETVEIDVSASKGNIALDKFRAVSGDLNVSVSGDVVKDGQVDLQADAFNMDVALLQSWTGITGISGLATVSVVAEGTAEAPQLQASVEMITPTFWGVTLDRVGAIVFADSKLELKDILFTKGEHSGRIKGTLPWDWRELKLSRDEPMNLRAELDKQSLGLLSVFTKAVETVGTGGAVDAYLDVGGSINAPEMDGKLSITDGSLNLTAFRTQVSDAPSDFKNIQATVDFRRSIVTVEKLTGSSGLGGQFFVSGTMSLQDFPNGPIDLKAGAKDLCVSVDNLSGVYHENVTATLTSDLKATGALGRPLVAGTASVRDGGIRISGRAEEKRSSGFQLPPEMTFDIKGVIGKDVWIYNPRLNALVTGSVSLSGSVAAPLAKGELVAQRGTIKLPTSRPELRRGGTISFVYAPPEPPQVILDLRATAPVFARSVLGEQRRYDIVMRMRGPLDNLALEARSEPPGLSQDQIFALLGHVEGIFGSGEFALRQEISNIFRTAVVPEYLSPLETAFAEALRLEEFRLELGGAEPSAVYVSRRLFGNFYASYWKALSEKPLESKNRLRLSYRWTNLFQLSLVVDERKESVVEVEGVISF